VARGGFQGGLAAVRLGDGRDDGKAEPTASALGGWPAPVRVDDARAGAVIAVADRGTGCRLAATPFGAAVEPVERPGGVLGSHARTAVRDLEHHTATDLGKSHRRGRGHRGVLADVAEQVGQHLPDAGLVHGRDQ